MAMLSSAKTVDPKNPAEWHARQETSPAPVSRWPRKRIQQLEEQRSELLDIIALLPQHNPNPPHRQFGFHSPRVDADTSSLKPIVISFRFRPQIIDSIALVPAFDPTEAAALAYAFPKRFKIEVLDHESGKIQDFVNWTKEDFPHPGTYPVCFAGLGRKVSEIHITVPRTEDAPFFALGEVYIFEEKGNSSGLFNITPRAGTKVTISESLEIPPQWGGDFLRDRVDGLGFPLSDLREAHEDLLLVSDGSTELAETVQIILELQQEERIERMNFWPAKAPDGVAAPRFGFPQVISIETSETRDFSEVWQPNSYDFSGGVQPGNLYSVWLRGHLARFIRITLSGLPEINGERILGLGEIEVTGISQDLSMNCEITATGLSADHATQLPRLIDTYSEGRRIIPEAEWIKGLAKRRPLDRRLRIVEQELEQAVADWRRMQLRLAYGGGAIGSLALVGIMILQRLQRRLILKKLRWRITRDLHDDVGSNLGTITLMTEDLVSLNESEPIKEDLKELALMTREASASLREVVWVIDQGTVHLPELLKKLSERAERVLSGVELEINISENSPKQNVSLTLKRHLMMFFKEAMHNCAQHSKATHVKLTTTVDERFLRISICDNGCGFDVSKPRDGWGVNNMKKRANELGGNLELESAPGKGTCIVLGIPLNRLTKEPKQAYGSSN